MKKILIATALLVSLSWGLSKVAQAQSTAAILELTDDPMADYE